MELNTVLITQARMSSTRLPGKVMLKVDGVNLIKIHLDRISKCKKIDKLIVATTTSQQDDLLFEYIRSQGYDCYRGSENDVLDRFYNSVVNLKPKWVVRVTSDCPLIDPVLIDNIIEYTQKSDKDYGSNTIIENYPDGQDVEVIKFSALEKAWELAKIKSDREHVTPYIRNNSDMNGKSMFTSINYSCPNDFSKIRMTVDEKKDFELVEILIRNLGTEKSWVDYVNYIESNNLKKINSDIMRNEGLYKSLKND